MIVTAMPETAPAGARDSWHEFRKSLWQEEINVRDFIQQNYQPYEGDESFLTSATERTKKMWKVLNELFVLERRKGVLAVSQIPNSITSHAPGYIDRENEVMASTKSRLRDAFA